MEGLELVERLVEIYNQNEPGTTSGTMPEDLKEAFGVFIGNYGERLARKAMVATLAMGSIEPILSGTLEQGFWLGHDYALEHGQLRGN